MLMGCPFPWGIAVSAETYPFVLAIERLAIPLYLGAGEDERSNEQTVYLSVKLHYPAPPASSDVDGADYLCYDTLCKKLLGVAAKQPYQLIEYLSAELLRAIQVEVPPSVLITLNLQKPLPFLLVGYDVQGAAVELRGYGEKR